MKLRITNGAADDMRSAAEWYAEQRSGLNQSFLAAIADTIAKIEKDPQRFGYVKRGRSGRDIRQATMKPFPYRLVYEIRTTELALLAVVHFSRREGFWRRRLD
jgi:hypothetical protein